MQTRQVVTNGELISFLSTKNNKFAKFMSCPGPQCKRLYEVIFDAQGIPYSQRRLKEMIGGSGAKGGIGNPDLNRRCLICAYRGYLEFYEGRYRVKAGNDVPDDFNGDSEAEADLLREPAKGRPQINLPPNFPQPRPQAQVPRRFTLQEVREFNKYVDGIFARIPNLSIWRALLRDSNFPWAPFATFENVPYGATIKTMFVPTDEAFEDFIGPTLGLTLEELYRASSYFGSRRTFDLIMTHATARAFANLDNLPIRMFSGDIFDYYPGMIDGLEFEGDEIKVHWRPELEGGVRLVLQPIYGMLSNPALTAELKRNIREARKRGL
jgi:hypothetical protein